jgi:hypothetical protein
MKEDDYIQVCYLSRLSIAQDILREIPPFDKRLTRILNQLQALAKECYDKMEIEE